MSGPQDSSLLIGPVRVLDPAGARDFPGYVGCRNGVIDYAGERRPGGAYAREISGEALWLMPAAIDLAARFREPGQSHKARFATESRAAIAGGIGTVVLPPDTAPVNDAPAVVDRIRGIAAQAPGLHYRLLGALTLGLKGEALAELSSLLTAGCSGFYQGLAPISDALVARRALEYAHGLGATVHVQAQDRHLANGGCAHEGAVATRLGLPGIPVAAEVSAMRMWLSLVEDTGARMHFGRISTARGAFLLESARARGLPVSGDVAAHQLFLTEAALEGFDARAHVLPPLRAQSDRMALREAVRSGVIDAICSDHQPHETDAKVNPFPLTEPGISGLETLIPLTLSLVREGLLSPLAAAARLTDGPARALGLRAPVLAPGAAADLTLIAPDREWTLRASELLSSGRHTPFDGHHFVGQVHGTIHQGAVVHLLEA